MLRTEIRKEKFTLPGTEDSSADEMMGLLKALEEESISLLGYSVPEKETPQVNDNLLLDALARLGMEILNWKDVMLYKVEEENKAKLAKTQEYLLADSPPRWVSYPEWRETKIASYQKPIPPFILEKAIQLKKFLPSVEIFVESLEENPDPFLVAKHKKGSYDDQIVYIDVWDEPHFKQV
jgi:hypothetical protein